MIRGVAARWRLFQRISTSSNAAAKMSWIPAVAYATGFETDEFAVAPQQESGSPYRARGGPEVRQFRR
jgi:hypothetical protein